MVRRFSPVAAGIFLFACGSPASVAPSPPTAEAAAPLTPQLSVATAVVEADHRRLDRLTAFLDAPLAEDRARAVLALARLHDPAAAPYLLRALRDPDASVRTHASLGLAGLGRTTTGAESAVLAALASETQPPTRADHLRDLGRLGGEASLPAFTSALASDAAPERGAACQALASFGLDHIAVGPDLTRRVAARAGDDPDGGVRVDCAHAVLRLPPADGLVSDLSRALSDADPEVRAMAVRALGHERDTPVATLEPALSDPDWDVALQAFRALGSRPEADRAVAAGLRSFFSRASAQLEAPRVLPALFGVLEAPALSLAQTAAVHQAADALLTESAAAVTDLDHARVHCAVARLVDLGRGWPGRLERCGGDLVSDAERARMSAEVMGLLSGAERERTAYLARLAVHPDVTVREATATALGTLDHPDGRPLMEALLEDPDAGVVISAVDALARRAERAVAARDAAELTSLLAATPAATPEPVDVWPDAAALTRLRAAAARFRTEDDLEGLVTALGAIGAVREAALGDIALGLALHHNLGVREAARAALDLLDLVPPEGHFAAPPNPLSESDVVGGSPPMLEVTTSRGVFVIELRPDWAPSTVTRIAGLTRSGFYDGLSFHRVVPAFVVQGGDPRGDGYGGPDWSQRCEDNRIRYERGVVGMALAGRDTGGSQFFVTLTTQPHLDGRYTAFGRVTEGMDVVERLVRGDTITSARLRP